MYARPRPDFDDMVGGAHGLFVVFDHDHGVADVAQPLQGVDHLAIVARVQTNARLIQHIQHAHQFRADLHREPHPLRFAARKGGGTAVEAEIVNANVEQQIDPFE